VYNHWTGGYTLSRQPPLGSAHEEVRSGRLLLQGQTGSCEGEEAEGMGT